MELLLHRHALHPPGESLAESGGDTEETELRRRKRLGSGSSLSCGPWSFSYVRSLLPLSALTHICCDAVAVTGDLKIFI